MGYISACYSLLRHLATVSTQLGEWRIILRTDSTLISTEIRKPRKSILALSDELAMKQNEHIKRFLRSL